MRPSVFCVRPSRPNVGNELIYLATRHMLSEAFGGEVNLISVPARRMDDAALTGLTASTVHEMNQYGDGVVVGGGNLYENFDIDLDVHALDKLGPPLMLFSLSRGRILDRSGELVDRTDVMPDSVIRDLHRNALVSIARDEATHAHLERLGVRSTLGGCPTLLVGTLDLPLSPPPPSVVGSALVAIRHPRLMNIPLAAQSKVHVAIQQIIELLRRRGHRVHLVCNDARDLTFASSFDQVDLLYPGDALAHVALLRAAAVVVTFRLHSFLPCVSFGTPAVNISYDERSESLVRTVGLGEWDVPFGSGSDVASRVDDRLDHLADLEALRRSLAGRWGTLGGVLRDACTEFAAAVRSYSVGQR